MRSDQKLDWIAMSSVIVQLQVNAGLREINWTHTFDSTVSRENLKKQKKLLLAVQNNKVALARWVGEHADLSDEKKTILRTMYKQYTDAERRIEDNISTISAFIDLIMQGRVD